MTDDSKLTLGYCIQRLFNKIDIMHTALEKIAACRGYITGDVVKIARDALLKVSVQSLVEEGPVESECPAVARPSEPLQVGNYEDLTAPDSAPNISPRIFSGEK